MTRKVGEPTSTEHNQGFLEEEGYCFVAGYARVTDNLLEGGAVCA